MLTILLELAGLLCLVVAGAHVHPAAAWAIAGAGLIGKAFEAETAARKAQKRRRSP